MVVSEEMVRRLFSEHIRLVPVDPDAYSKYAEQADEKDDTVLTWKVKPESLQSFASALTAALSDQVVAVSEPTGAIREMGWRVVGPEDGKEVFAALVVYENGPPNLTVKTIWAKMPVRIVPASTPVRSS